MYGEFVVKKDKLKNNRILNEIDKKRINELANPKTMVIEDYNTYLQVIVDVWTIFLANIKEINKHPDFSNNSKK